MPGMVETEEQMTATGHHNGEFYSLAPMGGRIRIVTYRLILDGLPARGRGLAVALGARVRKAYPLPTYFLTPARAEKWRALFMAGFAAKKRERGGIFGWEFVRGTEQLALAGALRRARELLEV